MDKKTKEEYIKWYKTAQKHVNDESVIPNLTDGEIIANTSKMDWLMFVKATHEDRKDAVNYPEPNIYLAIRGKTLQMGLTFNNAPSVDKLKNILDKKSEIEREKIVEKLLALDDSYYTLVNRKIREFWGPAPIYEEELEIQTSKLNDAKFQKIIKECMKIREEGIEHKKTAKHDSYWEGPTVDLVYVEVPKKEKSFFKAIDDIIPIFKLCVDIKSNTELEDLDLIEKIKKIDSWDWYIEEDRGGLAELLKEKFDIEISTQKLKKLMKRLKKK